MAPLILPEALQLDSHHGSDVAARDFWTVVYDRYGHQLISNQKASHHSFVVRCSMAAHTSHTLNRRPDTMLFCRRLAREIIFIPLNPALWLNSLSTHQLNVFDADSPSSSLSRRNMPGEATLNPQVGLMAQSWNKDRGSQHQEHFLICHLFISRLDHKIALQKEPAHNTTPIVELSSDRERRIIVYLRRQAKRKRNHNRRLSSAELGVEYGLPEVIA
ncbi:hypothetical protein AC579_2909 [Pseudocercospora musae]|uniref:Uncharacterized protein n=1 Tax=Pseudocercospora musae TaxID=113226 RepID=A0A139IU08_9PEZI|nr:hypothetical protein AC579_2909 [Pseudocercospora musae]